ncbi:DUF2927 domain-containing protein [Acuticoccus mangrovi]|uniref:DUF2927 domain-containing protein n=1 Tax=Acuticoccus mangrovi TaxID=2796142 RepID=A0A934IEB2_9HYPH|nr:DUF2927 domain-containing protein [Acuticoccus mangrovi]MBJ3774963.1 DUF2927 domain-containing protein [Acuticoccus mangrovi]
MFGRFTALIVACCLALPAVAADNAVHPDELTRGFFKTVFGLEYGGHVDAQRVKRYVDPVAFHIEDLSGLNRQADARTFLESLPKRIRHLRASVVDDASQANFRVILVTRDAFSTVVERELKADAFAMNARCLVGVSTVGGRIKRSTAVIVADDDFLFSRCLVEEVLQGLGPMNDDDSLTHSVFNDSSKLSHFTAFDQALLNVLYHPMIRPGMSGSEAQRVLPRVMHSLGYSD